jgi:hypothetical protein
MHDHAARVRSFGDAFVRSVTGSLCDYQIAARTVASRLDPRAAPIGLHFPDLPAPA